MPIGFKQRNDSTVVPGQAQPDRTSTTLSPAEEALLAAESKKRRRSPREKNKKLQGPVSALQIQDKRALRIKTLITALLVIVFAVLSLCLDKYQGRIASPIEVVQCYGMWISQLFANMTHSKNILSAAQLMAFNPSYYYLVGQFMRTLVIVISGMMLALAGTLYQNVFKNPIASPSMLGVSGGIQLGYVVLVLLFGAEAASHTGISYALAYGFGLGTLVLLFVVSKLMSGPRKPLNIVNMLVVGTLITQLVNVIINYITWYVFDDDLWQIYNTLNESIGTSVDTLSSWILIILAIVSVGPVLLFRFRLNVLSFSEEDMRMLGVNSHRLQLLALACSTIMMIGSQVAVGTVAMISLVVPHVSRAIFGAEFKKQFWGNIFIGALVLLICNDALAFVPDLSSYLPVGTIVNVIVLPVFVWMIATQQRSWE